MFKKLLLFSILFNLSISVFSQAVTYKVQNLNADGIGSLKYAVHYLDSSFKVSGTPQWAIGRIFFESTLTGEITITAPMTFKDAAQIILDFNPNVNIKAQGVDTIMVFRNIDILNLKNLKSVRIYPFLQQAQRLS